MKRKPKPITYATESKKHIISERNNLFEPNVYMTLLLNMTGNITEHELTDAIYTAYSKNESTMCKIVLDETGDAYYEKMLHTGCKVYVDPRNWNEIFLESERTPFRINEGEMIRSYIIPKGTEIDLLIMAHHLVGDGLGFLIFIEDIINSLAGKQLEYKPLKIIDKKFLIKNSGLSLIQKQGIKLLNRKWKKAGKVFTWEDYFQIHNTYWKSRNYNLTLKTYNKDELEAMERACKNGVTLNSYLITKILQKYPHYESVGIPVTIRGKNRSFSNQSGAITIKHQYNSNKSFDENALEIHNKIYQQLEHPYMRYLSIAFLAMVSPTLIDSALMYTYLGYENRLSEITASLCNYTLDNGQKPVGVTNIGKINFPCEYKNFKITNIIGIAPDMSYANNFFAICTCNDQLNITYREFIKNNH